MDNDRLRPWLILNHTPGLGPVRLQRLFRQFHRVEEILGADRAVLLQAGLSASAIHALRHPDEAALERELAWAQQDQAHIITWESSEYPPLLREIPDPPLLLYVFGDPGVLHRPQLAMVGSRNPTPMGVETAIQLAAHLAGRGLVITSGLAAGIDAAGHKGALDAAGMTVAVMGTGLDRVYPARHRELAHQIAEHGALVSEFALGSAPVAGHFPRRNRIISGLSRGVLVVEAAIQSGSLITAHQALEQGREVFAVPGSIHSPNSKGCHRLLRDGAKLVETVEDILEELVGIELESDIQATPCKGEADTELDADHRKVLENVGFEPTTVDTVVSRTGLTADAVCSMLLVLELQGFVCSTAAGQYCQRGKRTTHEREYSGRLDVPVRELHQ